jgi:pilus assembly protein CpaB
VDLVVTVERQGQRQSVTVLQHVQVMATGQRSADDAKSGERRLYTTVTLDTDPQQARNLILARESGRLTALLRNPGDASPVAGVPADFAAWLQPGTAAPQVRPVLTMAPAPGPEPVKGVPVLYGGRGGALNPDGLALTFKVAAGDALPAVPTAPHGTPEGTPSVKPPVVPGAAPAAVAAVR